MKIKSSRGPVSNFRQPSNAPQPAMTQSFVQQPQAHGKAYALTHQDAMTSNTVVEGMISISGHIARVLLDFRATHLLISSAFAYKLNQTPEPLGF